MEDRIEYFERMLADNPDNPAAAVLAAHVADVHNPLTEWGAQLYFWARVAYVPLYAAGVPVIRSLVWNVATIGIVLIIVALILG